jgi:hypothetical protein
VTETAAPRRPFRSWFLTGMTDIRGTQVGPHGAESEKPASWWRVMCLTGLDYFSTLGYQPAIAALAAGLIAPFATLVLVLLTLLCALPVYRRVARESFKGSGSIAMLERLLPYWWGKLLVLVLLGFAATDFMITMTLSAADATAHAIENPLTPHWMTGTGWQIGITILLLAVLAGVFLRGFREAMGIAVVLVGAYLLLNAIVMVVAIMHIADHPVVVGDWWSAMFRTNGNWAAIIGISLLVFPKLALGMSGFETGVAVMPQIKGGPHDRPKLPVGRIQGTKRLLLTASVIMSAFLITSSFTTTLLIPQQAFQPGGPANGRALAYLAHEYLGPAFGTVYDLSTILILWFAGASAMAGLLNLVPRYLPHYGMAPQWASAVRPLVVVFALIGFLITLVFRANVDAQGGAYATGVLVLMSSAALAVTASAYRRRQRKRVWAFGFVTVAFLYSTVVNVIERPDGVRIAALFILAILVISLVSRARRSFELRAASVSFDERAAAWLDEDAEDESGAIRIVTHEPGPDTQQEYSDKSKSERYYSHLPAGSRLLFLEVLPKPRTKEDSSDFVEDIMVRGVEKHGFRVLQLESIAIPNAIAAVLLEIRDRTGIVPSVYFQWNEGNPISNMARFLLDGTGEIAPVTREVLREAEKNPRRRPIVHVS